MSEAVKKQRGRPRKVEGPKFRVYAVRKINGAAELVEALIPESVIEKYIETKRETVPTFLPAEVGARIEQWLMGRAKW